MGVGSGGNITGKYPWSTSLWIRQLVKFRALVCHCYSDSIYYEIFSLFLKRNVTTETAVTCVIHNPEPTFVTAIRATWAGSISPAFLNRWVASPPCCVYKKKYAAVFRMEGGQWYLEKAVGNALIQKYSGMFEAKYWEYSADMRADSILRISQLLGQSRSPRISYNLSNLKFYGRFYASLLLVFHPCFIFPSLSNIFRHLHEGDRPILHPLLELINLLYFTVIYIFL